MSSQTNTPAVPAQAAASPEKSVLSALGVGKNVVGPQGSLTILQSLDIDVGAGEAVAIVGPSGSGKSTLLGILAGLDTPSAGRVELLGEPISSMDEDSRARLRAGHVGFVFQSFQLLPGLSAHENVMLPLELTGNSDAADRATKMLDMVGLGHRSGHQPLQLSGGEQQRVALARAFVIEPALLFADEPTGNLDEDTGEKVIELMFSLCQQQGSAIVLVTHDLSLAGRCDRVLRMSNGKLDSL
ncbi:MAG: ATP-binding cassette domain-containing protein [Granulosicoccus sp.]|nr:ATP-binding cassette domain-containing protein [Granulosicoccus sp.]